MTPDEANSFYEEDEDPTKIFAKFDAGPTSVTTAPGDSGQAPAGNVIYVQATGLYRELRRRELPPVSSAGPRSYSLGRA